MLQNWGLRVGVWGVQGGSPLVGPCLSEDLGLTTYFFPGRDGVGGMGIARCVVVVVDGPPNWTGSPMLKLSLQSYFLDVPVDD